MTPPFSFVAAIAEVSGVVADLAVAGHEVRIPLDQTVRTDGEAWVFTVLVDGVEREVRVG